MVHIQSQRLGELAVEDSQIITFPLGIPAFEEYRRFIVVELEQESPFAFFQSAEEGAVSWVVVNPFFFFSDYQFELSSQDKKDLQITKAADVAVFNFVTIRDSLASATVNLKAPLIMNVQQRLGKQVILDNPNYLIKHPLAAQLAGDEG